MKCQDDSELHELMTSDPYEAQVHVVPLQVVTMEKIEPYLSKYRKRFTSVVALRPTGWTYVFKLYNEVAFYLIHDLFRYTPPAGTDMNPTIPQIIVRNQKRDFNWSSLNLMRNSSSKFKMYGVPYSEHSSFFELTCFALSINVGKMVATVNVGSANSRGKMQRWFDKWEAERKRRLNDGKSAIIKPRHSDYW